MAKKRTIHMTTPFQRDMLRKNGFGKEIDRFKRTPHAKPRPHKYKFI